VASSAIIADVPGSVLMITHLEKITTNVRCKLWLSDGSIGEPKRKYVSGRL
jgi:hypothetical protein